MKSKIPKSRNPVAKALRSPHLAPKSFTAQKGKGSYSRKSRNGEKPSGSYHIWVQSNFWMPWASYMSRTVMITPLSFVTHFGL